MKVAVEWENKMGDVRWSEKRINWQKMGQKAIKPQCRRELVKVDKEKEERTMEI